MERVNGLQLSYYLLTGTKLEGLFSALPRADWKSASQIANLLRQATYAQDEQRKPTPYIHAAQPADWLPEVAQLIDWLGDDSSMEGESLRVLCLTPYQLSMHLYLLAIEPSE